AHLYKSVTVHNGLRTAQTLALAPGTVQPGLHTLGNSACLKGTDGCQQSDDGITELAQAVQPNFLKREKSYAMLRKLIQDHQYRKCALSGKPIQRPEGNAIEVPVWTLHRFHHFTETGPVCLRTRHRIAEMPNDFPTNPITVGFQGNHLIG